MRVIENILLGDCVEIIHETYDEFYDIVIGSSFGDELELQYFERK